MGCHLDRFEEELYEVMSQPRQDIPVFKIKSEKGVEKTLHRNHLLPVITSDAGGDTDGKENVVQRPTLVKMKSPEGPTIQLNLEKRKDAPINKGDTQVKPLEMPNEEADTDTESGRPQLVDHKLVQAPH